MIKEIYGWYGSSGPAGYDGWKEGWTTVDVLEEKLLCALDMFLLSAWEQNLLMTWAPDACIPPMSIGRIGKQASLTAASVGSQDRIEF